MQPCTGSRRSTGSANVCFFCVRFIVLLISGPLCSLAVHLSPVQPILPAFPQTPPAATRCQNSQTVPESVSCTLSVYILSQCENMPPKHVAQLVHHMVPGCLHSCARLSKAMAAGSLNPNLTLSGCRQCIQQGTFRGFCVQHRCEVLLKIKKCSAK